MLYTIFKYRVSNKKKYAIFMWVKSSETSGTHPVYFQLLDLKSKF